ncbi:MAG: YaiI/YqxD family protein [Clostridiaceae bacterium]|nr:YaiI/YqxD family protein [Clostridiaceae bacterium]
MEIFVDADACPVKEIIIKVAKERDIPVTMIMDTSHWWQNDYAKVINVDKERDGVDIALINMTHKNDIVVTQDYGVAAMALGKGAWALNQNGLIFSSSNMDKLLFERHLGQKVRRAGGRTKNIRRRTKEDDERFESALIKVIENAEKAETELLG